MTLRYNAGEVITAMATPFTKELEVDYKGAEILVAHLVETGTDCILIAGTTGESPTLTHAEELELLKVVKKAIGNKAEILMGAGSNCTKTAVEMTKEVTKAGADAILSVVPYYNKPSQEGLVEHFSKVAEVTNLPIVLYNIPSRTGINMSPDTIAELAYKFDNIVAVKQSNANLDLVTEIISKCPDNFAVYSGDDSLTLPMLALGAYGVVSVASHLIGKQIKQMITEFKKGNVKKAAELHHNAYPLFKAIFMCPNPVPVKAALADMKVISDYVRLPLVTMNELEKQELLKVYKNYK